MEENEKSCELLKVESLSKEFSLEAGFFQKNKKTVYAVNDVSFSLGRGETYGILGESGCGKTTTARLIIRMYSKTSGKISYFPKDSSFSPDVSTLKGKDLKKYREKVKYIFQDPAKSLNPRLTVLDVLTSALRYSSSWKGKKDAYQRAKEIMEEVGFCEDDLFRRPAEFSGGQRQRISIARSLIMNPELLICDEVVSALDVSVQGQVINLLCELKKSRDLSYIFITHDLKVASYFCDKIGVMYRGMLVEEGDARTLWKDALHPYTKLLFSGSKNEVDFSGENKSSGEVKTVLEKETACPFYHRCPLRKEECAASIPPFREVSVPGSEQSHRIRCFCV